MQYVVCILCRRPTQDQNEEAAPHGGLVDSKELCVGFWAREVSEEEEAWTKSVL